MADGSKRYRVRYRPTEEVTVLADSPGEAVDRVMDEHDLEFGQIVDVAEAE